MHIQGSPVWVYCFPSGNTKSQKEGKVSKDYKFELGRIAGLAESMGFEAVLASEVGPTRAVKLLENLAQTENAFSVPEINPESAEHILFVYHRRENRLVAAYMVRDGGYMLGCTLAGGNHDLNFSEIISGLTRMKYFEHFASIYFWQPHLEAATSL
jgi:hypothetical protein